MIKSFRHKGLRDFFETGSLAGIPSSHASKLAAMLRQLDAADGPQDMNVPGWKLHSLKGRLQEHFSVHVSGNWRLTFRFEGIDAVLVNYQDYQSRQ
ncbi:type II toxin-antitoxin system RelE/ParE family toxin [Duganella sp.]|uniref:type II toxin-antitoxin system RelE/ParE family toxin n=1 Tax=Duganella sp. TaxID=1904440 RepID=UPI0031DBC0EE